MKRSNFVFNASFHCFKFTRSLFISDSRLLLISCTRSIQSTLFAFTRTSDQLKHVLITRKLRLPEKSQERLWLDIKSLGNSCIYMTRNKQDRGLQKHNYHHYILWIIDSDIRHQHSGILGIHIVTIRSRNLLCVFCNTCC